MALIAVQGSDSAINKSLLNYAVDNAPVLLIDCANIANPHKLAHTSLETLHKIHVLQADILYKLRDTLKSIYKGKMKVKKIVITTFHLFHYQDEKENYNIFQHSWQLLKELSKRYTIFVGLTASHEEFAKRYADKVIPWATLSGAKE